MGYKLLGYVVWNVGGRYLRRRYGRFGRSQPSNKTKLVLLFAGGLAIAATVAFFGLNGGRSSESLDIEQ